MPWGLILDGLLAVLLLVTIVYAFLLNRRLSLVRSDRGDLEAFITRFNSATERAEASLKGLRAAAQENAKVIADARDKAQAMRDELAFLVERADGSAERLAKSSSRAAKPQPAAPAEAAGAGEADGQTKPPRTRRERAPAADGDMGAGSGGPDGGSEAERDLLNALRRAR